MRSFFMSFLKIWNMHDTTFCSVFYFSASAVNAYYWRHVVQLTLHTTKAVDHKEILKEPRNISFLISFNSKKFVASAPCLYSTWEQDWIHSQPNNKEVKLTIRWLKSSFLTLNSSNFIDLHCMAVLQPSKWKGGCH